MSRLLIENTIEDISEKYNKYRFYRVFNEIKRIGFDMGYIFDKINNNIKDYNLLNWLLDCLKVNLDDKERIKEVQSYYNIIFETFKIKNVEELANFSPDDMTIRDLKGNGISSIKDCLIINKNHEKLYNNQVIPDGKLIIYLKSNEENEKFNLEKNLFQEFVCDEVKFLIELKCDKYYPSFDF